MNSAADIWERVLSLMQQTMTETTISTWFSDAEPVALDENRFILYVPTDFKREIVVSRYLGDIKKALYDLFSADLEVVILNEEEKEKQRMNCPNWKSCVRKTGFFKQKSEKRNWKLYS